MSVELLDKTRKIEKLLHNNKSTKVIFNDICEVLSELLGSNVLVFSRKGKVLGVSILDDGRELSGLEAERVGDFISPALNERLLSILSTKEHVNLKTLGFSGFSLDRFQAIVNPIEIAGERLGTIFTYRTTIPYDIDDIIVSEYGTTVVGLEMMRSVTEEKMEQIRKVQDVKAAIGSLSTSEVSVIVTIMDELEKEGGVECLIASRIADRIGIARSVVASALRKFESAGIIVTHSAGTKGTCIEVKNDAVYDQMEELKREWNL